jgi:acetylornithine deacetylase/succinyl-diaminopimelate desuccinylase-like protein
MAAMLWALHERRDRLADSATEVTFVGLMGEETGQPGSIDFGRRHPSGYDFAIVGEPTECRIVHAHKGCAWIEVDVLGLAAHASTPDRGRSAILDAARLALALDATWRPELEAAFSHPLFGAPTLNIGLIRGGTRANIVPDRAVLTLDLRTTPAFDEADPLVVLAAFIDRTLPGLRVHFSQTGRSKPLLTPPEHPMLGRLARATGAPLATAPWFCDAAHLAAAGIPAVAAGPGSIAQAHTEDEWIALDALEDGVAFYGRFLDAIA